MDEISPTGVTDVWEVRGGEVRTWELDPRTHGLAVDDPGVLRGGDPPANARRLRRILEREGDDAPGLAAVLLNAAAAGYGAGLAGSYWGRGAGGRGGGGMRRGGGGGAGCPAA